MSLSLTDIQGCPIERQRFTWRELAPAPISKLDDDAYTRVRILLMGALEREALRFAHAGTPPAELRLPLACIARVELQQATLLAGLIGADHAPLEMTVAHAQAAIEVTAAIVQRESDEALARAYRFALCEHVDVLYRLAALLDRLDGRDANNLLQCYTDIVPGRPLAAAHHAPDDDVCMPVDTTRLSPLSRLNALALQACARQLVDHCLHAGPQCSDPVARMLYAEIASVAGQHLARYGALVEPSRAWSARWLLHELAEVYHYRGCALQESNARLRALWARFLDYELGQLSAAMALYAHVERRDPLEVTGTSLPDPLALGDQRDAVREVLARDVDRRAIGGEYSDDGSESPTTLEHRAHLGSQGVASEAVAEGYVYRPGTELAAPSRRAA